jgi:hypothetical protein
MDNLLMQWKEPGPARPMVEDGTKPESERCVPADGILFLAGTGITDVELGLVQSVSIVATPTFDPRIDVLDPCYITTGSSLSGSTLTLHARTWDCRCEPKPKTAFSYHAAIAYVFVG